MKPSLKQPNMESTSTRVDHRWQIVVIALVVVASLVAVIWWSLRVGVSNQPVAVVSPEISSSPTANVVVPAQTPTPSPSVQPTPSPTESAISLPASVSTFLANYYTAYSASDRARMESYFTVDTSTDLRELRSLLFTGKDLQGNPGGPLLFDSATTSERVTSYAVQNVAVSGRGWSITVQEQRTTSQGVALSPVSVTLLVLPGQSVEQSAWLIDSYTRTGQANQDKYAAFFSL
jgi:hypothetical protein